MDDLTTKVERSLADLETFAALAVEVAFRNDGRGLLRAQLEALNADAAALVAAHDELEAM